MAEANLGYYEDPINGDGICRARTTRLIRSWMFERNPNSLSSFYRESGNSPYPGMYILFEGAKKIYVGEANDLYTRLKTHSNTPDEKIQNWNKVLIINDGRSANQSEFNDPNIRKFIENHLNNLFKLNKYKVVSQTSLQNLNAVQRVIVENFLEELNFFLRKKNLISKFPEELKEQEITSKELFKLLRKKGYNIANESAYEVTINAEKSYIRPGSKKTKGWQITFRDKFKDSLNSMIGYLIIPRGGVLIVPMKTICDCVAQDTGAFTKSTIDVFIKFSDDRAILIYKQFTIDITAYMLN